MPNGRILEFVARFGVMTTCEVELYPTAYVVSLKQAIPAAALTVVIVAQIDKMVIPVPTVGLVANVGEKE
jgi:hypothetical protein